MAKLQETKTWKEFADYTNSLTNTEDVIFFRGQADSLQPLECSLKVFATKHNWTPQITSLKEKEFITAFMQTYLQEQTHTYYRNASLFSLLAAMQHYGIPTRLLDWTISSHVAAYFAVSGTEAMEKDGAVWWFNKTKAEANIKNIHPNYEKLSNIPGVRFLDEGNNQPEMLFFKEILKNTTDVRMLTQAACFTCSTIIDTKHDVYLQNVLDSDAFGKIIMRSDLKKKFVETLNGFSLNAERLYPALDDSVARHIKEKVLWGIYQP